MPLASLLEDQAEGLRRLFAADARRMVAMIPSGGDDATHIVSHLAYLLAGQGKKILLLDEMWVAGVAHPVFGVAPRYDLGTVVLRDGELEDALVKTAEGIDFLAGAAASSMPRPKMETRIGLVNAFYRLAGHYDVVLVNACVDAANSRPSFAWACQDVIVLTDGSQDSATEAYARIKLLHQSDKRRFHLLFCGLNAERASALYRGIAAVSRRHLRVMPENLGAYPQATAQQAGFLRNLAATIQAWPVPEQKAGNFPDLMRRLLRGADPHALQALLK